MSNLTPKQQLTLKHLFDRGINKVDDIVSWCNSKIRQSRKVCGVGPGRRKHSKAYYRGIINALN